MAQRGKSAHRDGDDDDEREKSPAASEHDHEQPKQLHPHVTSTPIRWRVIVLHYKAWTVPEIMDALGVSRSTCYAVIKLFEASGDVKPRSGKRPRELSNSDLANILQMVLKNPGLYLREYRSLLLRDYQLALSNAALCRALHDLGFNPKKLSALAQAADAVARAEFLARMPTLDTSRLVFFDETRIDDRSLNRSHGWGQRGQRLQRTTLYINGIRYSLRRSRSKVCWATTPFGLSSMPSD